MPPWEKYQQSSPVDGPWSKYQGQDAQSSAGRPTASPENPQIGVVEDVAKSIGSNWVGGGIDLAMTLPNLVNSAVAGPQLLGRGVADTISPLLGATPQPRGELWQPFFSSGDVENAIGTAYDPKTTAGKSVALPARIGGGITGAKGLQKGYQKVTAPKKIDLKAQDIRDLSSKSFVDAEKQGGILKPQVTDKFVDEASKSLPQTNAGKIVIGETSTTKLVDRLQSLRGKPLTLKETQEIDSALGDMMSNEVDTLTGRLNAEGNKILKIQQSLRDSVEKAGVKDVVGGKGGFESLDKARKLWATSARANDIERIINRASMTDNPATAIKSGFRALASNPSRLRGFNTSEVMAIKKAAKTGVVTGALKIAGSRLNPLIGAATGGFSGAATGYGISEISRAGANKLQMNRANKALETVINRPVVRQAAGINPPAKLPNINGPKYDPIMSPAYVAPLFNIDKLLQN